MKHDLFGPVIFSYSIQDAVRDGVLVRVEDLFNGSGYSLLSHLTNNLLRKHYWLDGAPNKAGLLDLLQEATRKVHLALARDPEEWLVAFKIETPNCTKIKVWAERNEIGKFTLLLPEEH